MSQSNEQARTFIAVPFEERDQAKALGARWDRQAKSWYVPAGREADAFAKWHTAGIPGSNSPTNYVVLASTALINELAEAAHANQLNRALGRWERLDLICIDELGYVPLAETACELMFQVIPNPRLCKALIDRLTDQAHIITTGTDSYRFRRTTAQRKTGKS